MSKTNKSTTELTKAFVDIQTLFWIVIIDLQVIWKCYCHKQNEGLGRAQIQPISSGG
jgi:hypothetical protein